MNQSLFTRLYRIDKLEDFTTEILAEILRDHDNLCHFIRHFLNQDIYFISECIVRTQECLSKIKDHPIDSIPDITIRFKHQEKKYTIFFENKIDSSTHDNQLERYKDHLLNEDSERYLIYLTKLYAPADMKNNCNIKFIRIRWYQIYQYLKEFDDNYLLKQFITFMEDEKMNQSRIFTPEHLIGLRYYQEINSMMKEVFVGNFQSDKKEQSIKKIMEKSFDFDIKAKAPHYDEGNSDYRLVGKKNDIYIFCAFNFKDINVTYTCCEVVLTTNGKDKEKINDRLVFFDDFKNEFHIVREESKNWRGIRLRKYLNEIIGSDDDIYAIQKFFEEGLKCINNFTEKNFNKDFILK